jgi:branched-chain amino acid transport system permease protein
VSLGSAPFWVFVFTVAGIYAMFGLGLQIQLGFAGLMNLGVVAFMAIAAYTMAILVVREGIPLWAASLAGIGAAVLFGLAIGLTSLRLRAEFFAITTFALAEIVRYVATNAAGLTGGTQGTVALAGPTTASFYNTEWLTFQGDVRRWLHDLTGASVSSEVAMLVIVWVAVAAVTLILQFVVHRPWGRVLRSIREDEDVAAALGKNVLSYKLQALALGGAIAGFAGLLYAFQFSFFGPLDFDPLTTLIAFMVVILGGPARNWGVAPGAIVYGVLYAATRFLSFPPVSYLSSSDRAYLRLIVVGAVLVLLMAFRPQGLFGKREELALD